MTVLLEATKSDVRQVIAEALKSASTASVISAFMENRGTRSSSDFRPSVITLMTVDGQEIRVSTLAPNSSSTAELVAAGTTIDAAPSGTFFLACGKTLTVESGRLIGGSATDPTVRDLAVFFLFASDRELSL